MPSYILNKKEYEGHHEFHESDCPLCPDYENQERLGWFSDCHGALSEAEDRHPSWVIDGCKHCSEPCHIK